jgi:hypothetical protein
MRAMTLATFGWGVIWGALASSKLGWTPPILWIYLAAMTPGTLGLLFMVLVAVFANGSLVALPFLFDAEFRIVLYGTLP